MKIFKIIDCNNNEHDVLSDFIYKFTQIDPAFGEKKSITQVHIAHKENENNLEIIKTYEPITSIKKRLETHLKNS
ncbi:hypothetical protein [Myroides indicus]|uniref:Uncharacterized protein n=1 Tax=Myroides indicus TaxID=1323422 RepID=A0A4R7EQI5_9FLAO|nr:hypothetical protein [Myroides indicus]TDS54595.1 hypothetical protein C8P70_12538 [Myroides indicus]